MEIPTEATHVRTCEAIKRKVLKDGTVKEYRYQRKYNVKEGRVVCGKIALQQRITACRDKEKIEKIKALCDELGL